MKRAKAVLIASMGAILMPLILSGPVDAQPTFIAVLNGGNEIPPTTSNSIGVAQMTYDSSTNMLCYSISFTDLVAPETAAHFHGPATPGEEAGVLFGISPMPSPLGSPKTGCVGPLTMRQATALRKGLFYINVHSETFLAGEIRGQVLPTLDVR